MRKLAIAFSVVVSTTAAFLACSSDKTTSTGDSGTPTPDSGGGGPDAIGADTLAPINGCSTFTDRSNAADTRSITWDLSVASTPNHCMLVKVGQSVTWLGNFTSHPLGPLGGATPNPITGSGATTNDAGQSSATIAFPSAGDYGYVCGIHASMTGAIRVVP